MDNAEKNLSLHPFAISDQHLRDPKPEWEREEEKQLGGL